MASLLLLLQAVIGDDADEGLVGAREPREVARQQLEKMRFPPAHHVTHAAVSATALPRRK
jgi:hypothetical protein